MMLVVAHPDDDLLWFGGLLPYYAGEKGLRVQVVYLAPTSTSRRTELLAALWECGVTAYPTFLGFHDKQAKDLNGQYKMWRKSRVFS